MVGRNVPSGSISRYLASSSSGRLVRSRPTDFGTRALSGVCSPCSARDGDTIEGLGGVLGAGLGLGVVEDAPFELIFERLAIKRDANWFSIVCFFGIVLDCFATLFLDRFLPLLGAMQDLLEFNIIAIIFGIAVLWHATLVRDMF